MVKEENKIRPEVYDRILEIPEEQIDGIVNLLLQPSLDLAKRNNNKLLIFEPGAGTGLISLPFLNRLYKQGIHVSYSAIDKDKSMVEKFNERLDDKFLELKPYVEYRDISFEQWKAEILNNVSKDIREEAKHRYDILLDFWFLHHLEDKWRDGLRILLETLKPGGLFIITEEKGDIPIWGWPALNEFSPSEWQEMDPSRKKFIMDGLKLNETLWEKGLLHVRNISAGDRKPVFDILKDRLCKEIFERPEDTIFTWTHEIKQKDWLDGIKSCAFSNIAHINEKTWKEFTQKEECWKEREKEATTGKQFQIERKVKFSAFAKPRRDEMYERYENYSKSLIQDYIPCDIYDRIAEIRPKEYSYRRYGVNRLKLLLNSGAIENPLFVYLVSYDLYENKWRDYEVPLYFSSRDDELPVVFIAHLAGLMKMLPGFRGINFIFRELPLKAQISSVTECSSVQNGESLVKTIFKPYSTELDCIKINVPKYSNLNDEHRKSLKNFLEEVKDKYREWKKEAEGKSYGEEKWGDYEIYGEGVIINSGRLYDIAKILSDAFPPELDKALSEFRSTHAEQVYNELEVLFSTLGEFIEKVDLSYEKEDLKSFARLLIETITLFNLVGEVEGLPECIKYSYYPSKTHAENTTNNYWRQYSAGGSMIGLSQQTNVNEACLEVLHNLSCRSDAIEDWGKKEEEIGWYTVSGALAHGMKNAILNLPNEIHSLYMDCYREGTPIRKPEYLTKLREAIENNSEIDIRWIDELKYSYDLVNNTLDRIPEWMPSIYFLFNRLE